MVEETMKSKVYILLTDGFYLYLHVYILKGNALAGSVKNLN